MSLAVRLARRPWKVLKGRFWEMRSVKEVLGMDHGDLRRLFRIIYASMGRTNRNIAETNLRSILRGSRSVMKVTVRIKSPLVGDKSTKKEVLKEVRRWAQAYEERCGLLLVVKLMVVAKASRSMFDILNSSGKWAKKSEEEMQCVCCNDEYAGMWKFRGHILHPMSVWAKSEGLCWPVSWNAKSRCVPRGKEEVKAIREELKKVEENVDRKVKAMDKIKQNLQVLREASLEPSVEVVEAMSAVLPNEEDVLKAGRKLDKLVVGPVDKHSGEMWIACPCKWGQAVVGLASEMRKLEPEEEGAIRRRMFNAAVEVEHLPFASLKKAKEHRWGPLRVGSEAVGGPLRAVPLCVVAQLRGASLRGGGPSAWWCCPRRSWLFASAPSWRGVVWTLVSSLSLLSFLCFFSPAGGRPPEEVPGPGSAWRWAWPRCWPRQAWAWAGGPPCPPSSLHRREEIPRTRATARVIP